MAGLCCTRASSDFKLPCRSGNTQSQRHRWPCSPWLDCIVPNQDKWAAGKCSCSFHAWPRTNTKISVTLFIRQLRDPRFTVLHCVSHHSLFVKHKKDDQIPLPSSFSSTPTTFSSTLFKQEYILRCHDRYTGRLARW